MVQTKYNPVPSIKERELLWAFITVWHSRLSENILESRVKTSRNPNPVDVKAAVPISDCEQAAVAAPEAALVPC